MESQFEETSRKLIQQLSVKEEQQVGIKCYVSKQGGCVPAITKYLLTDFIVNEIDIDEKLVYLKEKPSDAPKYLKPQKQVIDYAMTGELQQQIGQILGKECAKEISELYKKLKEGEKISEWQTMMFNAPSQKQARIRIHSFVREKLKSMESNTLDNNQIRIKFNKKMKKMNPAFRKKYLHFTLFKSNIDTMGAIFKISKLTNINQKLFSSAGLKDKRGVTTQRVSIYNTDKSYLQRFYEHAQKNKQIWIADIEQNKDCDIGVGDLWGNQFGLILRLINSQCTQIIQKRIESLRNIGMINYFGMQRFGSCETRTHMLGVLVVKKQWQELVEKLLLQKTRDSKADQIKEQCYRNKQYAKGEKFLPFRNKLEKNIFKSLNKYGENYQNVFGSLPRSMRTLYCHALQSYIWNRIVSRRIQQKGLQIQEGDIVGKEIKGFQLAKKQAEQQKEEEQVDDGELKQEVENVYEPILVTAQNINNYSIQDVILPLYGPTLSIPEGSFALEMIGQELKNLDLSEKDFSENAKLLCFKGQYRKMIVKPKQVQYKLIKHQQKKQQLQSPFYTLGEEKQITPGKLISIHLQLQLPKSSYATMAIRQLLHIPSSFEAQMHLNKIYDQLPIDQCKQK